jgi:cyclin-dependent kinase-like
MDKYERLGVLGEGSYGVVTKCRHKETGQIVAVKKFIESEDDKVVKKIAHREIRMLKQLRHENLISLLDVFHRKKRLFLVFEFMDRTVLDDMERKPEGLNPGYVREIVWQVLKGVEFIHDHQIIHRDVKPENILVSKHGIVKLCDFGFARAIAQPGEKYTDYVATRWYRAPELLVGDPNYGKAVDIWAIGCLFPEMLTGEPLFPGNSDIDQIYLVRKCFGNLPLRFREILRRNENFIGVRHPEPRELEPIERRFPHLAQYVKEMIKLCLKLEPNDRKGCSELLKCPYFTHDSFDQMFTVELRGKIMKDMEENPLVKSLGVTIHGSAHDYLMSQQQSTAPPAVLQTSLTDLIDGTVDVARKEEKKKVKKKVTKAKKVGEGKTLPTHGSDPHVVMRRPKEQPTTFMKPPEMDSRHKKNSFPQTADPSYLKGPATLSQTNVLNGRRSGISTPMGGPHPQYTVTSPTPHGYTPTHLSRPPSKKISISSNAIDLVSQPMHNLRHPGSNSPGSGSGQVGSVSSITGASGISSSGNSDISPEKTAQNRLRQSAKGHPLITDVLLSTGSQGSSPGTQRTMPTLRKPVNPLQLPTLPKDQDKMKVSPTNGPKSPLIGFVSTLGQTTQVGGTSGGTGVGKSLLLGAMGGPSAYLSSVPTKVQVSLLTHGPKY